MGTITLRDIDEDVLRRIESIADRNGMSFDAQAKRILTDAVQVQDRRGLVARLEAIAAMTPAGVAQPDSTDLLREDRGR